MQARLPDLILEICPVSSDELDAILNVYRQCEDFLALGPVPAASMGMVLKDLQLSREQGGVFCGIYKPDGEMIGVVDYIPGPYQGDPSRGFLELLMIAASFRSRGIGQAIVEAVESEIRKDAAVRTIQSGVQVNNPQAIRFWQRNGYHIVSGPELMPDETIAYALQKDL